MKILVSAIEPSANLHLKEIIKGCKECEFVGIFDKKLGSSIDSNQFNVMGFLDVLPKIKLAKETIEKLSEEAKNADKVLLIDAPSFNLRLAKKIKEKYPKKEIIYYILPKVWAWKKGRIRDVNNMWIKKHIFFLLNERFGEMVYM